MGLLDDYSGEGGILRGLGKLARPTPKHQFIKQQFELGLLQKIDKTKLIVLSESCIDVTNLNSKAPDVIVYDKNFIPLMFIEITTTREKKKIEKKAAELMEQYNIYECFIYDYETKVFNKLTGLEKYSPVKSYSDLFKIDLQQFI